MQSHPINGAQKHLDNVREYVQYEASDTNSTCVGVDLQNYLPFYFTDDIDFNAELLQKVNQQQIQDMQNGVKDVEQLLNSVSSVVDLDEINDTQPMVIKLLEHIIKMLKVDGYTWAQDIEIPRSTANQVRIDPLTPRVYCPRSSQPDVMLQKIGHEDIIGAVCEVKRDFLLSGPSIYNVVPHALQAAVYGISFIQRVYPMLPADVVSDIFGDKWYFYVPLLSHKSLFMVCIDLNFLFCDGKIQLKCSKRQSGRDMATMLSSWVLWALQVQQRLVEHSADILQPHARHCWIPPGAVWEAFWKLKASELTARPSFYNPIYIDYENKRVYKLYSLWSGNNYILPFRLLTDRVLCDSWDANGSILSMPLYEGGNLHSRPPNGIMQLRSVLLQLVDILSYLGEKHSKCHCDIRAANICWAHDDDDKIVLIDYDLAGRFTITSLKPQHARDSAPESHVSQNYDLWLMGVMILQWTSQNFNWDFVLDRRTTVQQFKSYCVLDAGEINWKEEFAQHSVIIHTIVEHCLQLWQHRWLLQDLRSYLKNMI
ncbi:hypothetical protein MIR68_012504 [Amoeboaphelidium protococcarum]|nr:hypothetical protein MIR68_012504 [Amoeboaphelidium protococcarum]